MTKRQTIGSVLALILLLVVGFFVFLAASQSAQLRESIAGVIGFLAFSGIVWYLWRLVRGG